MQKIKVLLVDNDDFMKIYFRDVFWIQQHRWKNKYEVQIAETFSKALELINDSTTRPDVIFLDPNIARSIPSENKKGVELNVDTFLRQVKDGSKTKKIPVVFFSYHKKDKDLKAKKSGVDGSFDKGDLIAQKLIPFINNIVEKI